MISAHGLGGAKDLPIPPELAIAGAVAALTISFTVLAIAWRTPRYDGATSGRPAPAWLTGIVDATWWTALWRIVGFLAFLYTAMVAVFGQDLLTNPVFGIFYIWWWVGIVWASLLFGPFWKAISPARTLNWLLAKLSGGSPSDGVFSYPERLGYWPAAIGLYAFVWMELVYPNGTELGSVRLWCVAYVAVMLVGGALFGDTFYERADPFEVYSSLVAKLSIWGRRNGLLVIRSPLANLDTVVPRAGLLAVTAVLFGSTAFDSFRDSTTWIKWLQNTAWISEYSWAPTLVKNAALLGFCLLVGLIFAIGTMATGVARGTSRRALPILFAHSIVPIIVGYIVAHYLSYFFQTGQGTLIAVSDPFSNGADWFGTADLQPNLFFSHHPTLLASLKVVAVVAGHVLGVISSHDRALKLLPKQHQLTGQLPLLFAMVSFTVGGLYLLFSA